MTTRELCIELAVRIIYINTSTIRRIPQQQHARRASQQRRPGADGPPDGRAPAQVRDWCGARARWAGVRVLNAETLLMVSPCPSPLASLTRHCTMYVCCIEGYLAVEDWFTPGTNAAIRAAMHDWMPPGPPANPLPENSFQVRHALLSPAVAQLALPVGHIALTHPGDSSAAMFPGSPGQQLPLPTGRVQPADDRPRSARVHRQGTHRALPQKRA